MSPRFKHGCGCFTDALSFATTTPHNVGRNARGPFFSLVFFSCCRFRDNTRYLHIRGSVFYTHTPVQKNKNKKNTTTKGYMRNKVEMSFYWPPADGSPPLCNEIPPCGGCASQCCALLTDWNIPHRGLASLLLDNCLFFSTKNYFFLTTGLC